MLQWIRFVLQLYPEVFFYYHSVYLYFRKMPRQHFKFSLISHPQNRHDIPLAHYFPSKHTDTSCSASKWADQRGFKVNRLRANAFPSSSALQESLCLPLVLAPFGRWWTRCCCCRERLETQGRTKRVGKYHFYSTCYEVTDASWAFHSHLQHPDKTKTGRWQLRGIWVSVELCD